jgi:hypothetical protein
VLHRIAVDVTDAAPKAGVVMDGMFTTGGVAECLSHAWSFCSPSAAARQQGGVEKADLNKLQRSAIGKASTRVTLASYIGCQ